MVGSEEEMRTRAAGEAQRIFDNDGHKTGTAPSEGAVPVFASMSLPGHGSWLAAQSRLAHDARRAVVVTTRSH